MLNFDWISENTLIDTVNHPVKTVWLEEHRNQAGDERVFIVCKRDGVPEAYEDFKTAFNAIGAKYGFSEQWKKIE